MKPIIKVEIGRFDYDVVGHFKFLKPDSDGRIRRPSVLVKITDIDGYEGWGQAVPVPTWTYETVETVTSTLIGYLGPVLLGLDPEDIQLIHKRMDATIRPAFSVGQPLCKAAIDMACYDIIGKRKAQSVSQLLGGTKVDALRLSWTIASPDMAIVEEQLAEGHGRGYRNFNIKVGTPQTSDYDIELARKVRRFAPEGFLWADANTGYTTEQALEMASRLADVGVDVLESPLPPARIRGYQSLKKLGALPILMDEGIVSPIEVEEFIALDMLDGIAMKPARNAGIYPSRHIIQLLQDHNLMVLGSGLTDPDLSLATALHVFAWAGIDKPCALNGPQFLADRLTGTALVPDGDHLPVPQGAGLGLNLDDRAESSLTVIAEIT